MLAYEFYWRDPGKEYELVGILPERRKNPSRITQYSVIKWGRMFLSDNMNEKGIFFKKVTLSENTDKFF